jgi:hypothetical protein
MRAPKRRRPLQRKITPPPAGFSLKKVARKVRYVGSPEHKSGPSFAGMPRPRADASICDQSLSVMLVTVNKWLRSAVSKGTVGGQWEGGFPRYAWYKNGDIVYEARLTNQGKGEYKGYPIRRDEWPEGIEKHHG